MCGFPPAEPILPPVWLKKIQQLLSFAKLISFWLKKRINQTVFCIPINQPHTHSSTLLVVCWDLEAWPPNNWNRTPVARLWFAARVPHAINTWWVSSSSFLSLAFVAFCSVAFVLCSSSWRTISLDQPGVLIFAFPHCVPTKRSLWRRLCVQNAVSLCCSDGGGSNSEPKWREKTFPSHLAHTHRHVVMAVKFTLPVKGGSHGGGVHLFRHTIKHTHTHRQAGYHFSCANHRFPIFASLPRRNIIHTVAQSSTSHSLFILVPLAVYLDLFRCAAGRASFAVCNRCRRCHRHLFSSQVFSCISLADPGRVWGKWFLFLKKLSTSFRLCCSLLVLVYARICPWIKLLLTVSQRYLPPTFSFPLPHTPTNTIEKKSENHFVVIHTRAFNQNCFIIELIAELIAINCLFGIWYYFFSCFTPNVGYSCASFQLVFWLVFLKGLFSNSEDFLHSFAGSFGAGRVLIESILS